MSVCFFKILTEASSQKVPVIFTLHITCFNFYLHIQPWISLRNVDVVIQILDLLLMTFLQMFSPKTASNDFKKVLPIYLNSTHCSKYLSIYQIRDILLLYFSVLHAICCINRLLLFLEIVIIVLQGFLSVLKHLTFPQFRSFSTELHGHTILNN